MTGNIKNPVRGVDSLGEDKMGIMTIKGINKTNEYQNKISEMIIKHIKCHIFHETFPPKKYHVKANKKTKIAKKTGSFSRETASKMFVG